jgi:threonine synthase
MCSVNQHHLRRSHLHHNQGGRSAIDSNFSQSVPRRNLNDRATIGWLLCGTPSDTGGFFWGCSACGAAAPLTLAFTPSPGNDLPLDAAIREARRAYALFSAIGIAAASRPPTPLDAAPRFGSAVHLKNEAFSLTGSHKDRYHAIASRVAALFGARGIVASSTGNHGVSAAAHAAAAGLPAVVFCHPKAPAGLLRAIGAFGGIAVQVPPDAQRNALVSLVEDGWFPATSMDPALSGAGNPFGAEGYKETAYETVTQLGRMPEAFFIPTAGGDTFYGIMKGFAELAELSGAAMPVVFSVQPEGANALSRSVSAGRQVTVDYPASIALSLSDQKTGRHAMVAIEQWGGQTLDVAEEAIRAAIIDLARMGIYTDPASAASLAGYRLAVATGRLDADAAAVLLLTSSGFKWPDAMAQVFPAGAVQSIDQLRHRLAQMDPSASRTMAPTMVG